jgi:hypothetical protein
LGQASRQRARACSISGLFFLARRVQHEIDDLLRRFKRARMADAEAQAPEIGRAELGLMSFRPLWPPLPPPA